MTGAGELIFPDGESLADLATFVRRAAGLAPDGAVRLQVSAASAERPPVLAAWVCVLPGQGLLLTGLVLGLRAMAVSPDTRPVDVTVPLAALSDRFARRAATGGTSTTLPVPPSEVSPPWAAQTPPRGAWEPVTRIPSDQLAAAARQGIAEVAEGAPDGSGAAAVAALRARVWGRPLPHPDGHDIPAGAAFGAHALGFLPTGDPGAATVHRSGPWWRVSTPAGHVVLRP